MSGPRLSIIPAGAITDRSLEGGDLRVLGLLGRHTDKGGWCVRSQVKMAAELGIGRATVQRSLERLAAAGWVEKKRRDNCTKRPCYSYAYRVRLDTADVLPPDDSEWDDESDVTTSHAETAKDQGGCPPVGTPVPIQAGTGARVCAGTMNDTPERDSGGSGDPRAREPRVRISADALAFADELARIAGHDPAFLPPRWVSDGPALRVQMMLDHGWHIAIMRQAAKAVMARKHDGAPWTVRYFERAFARAHLPQPPLRGAEVDDGEATERHPKDWRARNDRKHAALAELRSSVAADQASEGGG